MAYSEHSEISKEVVIFHSNDLHSRLEQAAKIASIIEEGRIRHGKEHVIAVDLGDHMDRARMETEGTDGFLHRDILQGTDYDIVTLGNNEGLTFTIEQLDAVYSSSSFQVICSNIERIDGTMPKWLTRSTIIERSGLRIGFVAATAHFVQFYRLMGWETLEPIEAIKQEVERIRSACDVIVLMSHLGIVYDEQIADECEHIDIILGSHTHHLFDPPKLRSGTLLCAAEKFGSYVGKVVISYDEQQNKIAITGEVIPTTAHPEHTGIMGVIADGRKDAERKLSRVITVLREPLEVSDHRESPLANLLAIGLRNWCDAEIGIVNSGQLLGSLATGPVTAGELHAICPSPINPCLMLIKGDELLLALEQSLLREYQDFKPKGYGFRGEQLGTLAVDGLRVYYSLENPPLERILSVHVNGEILEREKIYRVASIDMFTFNVGYKSLANYQEVQFFLPEFIRNIMEYELKSAANITDCKIKRWIKN
ncbi:bifunctional metallophosphatase/5'-nucleotidase [Paenibacillus septentrionalis]|uniref:Bifunctional metallophosphatase/5'-nucleotidase n=1 Tax=Paenibacillus septentrionalis TaxID=429342 RepID=A0ABW1V1I8_9BACL